MKHFLSGLACLCRVFKTQVEVISSAVYTWGGVRPSICCKKYL